MAGGNTAARTPAPLVPAEPVAHPPGDPVPSFAAIYELYFDFVWASVRSLGVSSEALDDVVQEVFVVIHSRIHTLQQPDSLRSWIYGVVRRTVSSYRRSRRTRETTVYDPGVFDETLQSNQLTPFELANRNDQLQLLSKVLAELDAAKREVFMLAELEEMPVPEIAQALEIPLNTAYSRLRAARQAFEQALARTAARERIRKPQ
jgi:RNA polymerase sigma-70 factor (ECF subfamily)